MLTERMMQEAIFRLIFTDESIDDVRPEKFGEPWRTAFLMAERFLDTMEPEMALTQALMAVAPDGDNGKKWDWAAEQTAKIKVAGTPLHFPTYVDLDLPPIRWLWEPWIPRGMMTLAAGFPGAGKTWLALDVARSVLTGDRWPDGHPVGRPGKVIYVEGEAVPQISKARIEKMGLLGHPIYPMMPQDGEILNLTQQPFQHRLIDMVCALKPDLIVVDSLSDVDDGGQNSKEEVQRLLRFLVELARLGDCGLLVLHHLKKPGNGQQIQLVTMHDLRGSGYIAAQGRVIWGYSVVSASGFDLKDGKRHLQIMKTNLDQWADAMGVDLIDLPDGGKRLAYGEAPQIEATSMKDDCDLWLLEYLEREGPSKVRDVVAAAAAAGYNRGVVYRSRESLEHKIVNTHGRKHPQNRWSLAGEESQESQESQEFSPRLLPES